MTQPDGYYDKLGRIIKALLTKPLSLRDLADETGVHYESLRPMINTLRESGVVFVSHWRVDGLGRASIACYQMGFGVDAPKRKPKTPAQRSMKYKNKKLAEQDALTPMSATLVANNAIDMAMRGWGVSA